MLVWDPSVYNATLEQWYNKPDWPFFEQFFSKRLMTPEDPLYLVNPGQLSIQSSFSDDSSYYRVSVVHVELATVRDLVASTSHPSILGLPWHHAPAPSLLLAPRL